MRLLHVVPSYIPAWRYGGPIHSVHGLCKALAARGHQVDVATTNVDGDSDSNVPLGESVGIDGVNVYYFPSRRLRRIYFSPPMYRFLARAMRCTDVVHTHSVFLWPTAAAAHLARASAIPYVLSPRGMLVDDLIARRSSLVKRAWIALVERRNVMRAAAVHVTSDVEAADLLALGLRPARVFAIPNGVDFKSGEAEQVGNEIRDDDLPPHFVLYLGRISWKKGLDRLVSAIALVRDAQLVIAGNDDEAHLPKILQQAADLGVASRVRYVGFVEGGRKSGLLSQASMLVLPSYSENFGNVVLEAMAAGLPAVVTREVGAASVLADNDCGLVVGGSPQSIADAIARLLSDDELRARMGANATAAARNYGWSAVAEKMEAQYLSLVRQ